MKYLKQICVVLCLVGFMSMSCTRSKASCKKGHKSKKGIEKIQYQ